jgi:hypothetical protein
MKYKAFCRLLGTAGAQIAHKFTIAVGKGIHLRFLESAAWLPTAQDQYFEGSFFARRAKKEPSKKKRSGV